MCFLITADTIGVEDVVGAYKSILKEKEALEQTVAAFTGKRPSSAVASSPRSSEVRTKKRRRKKVEKERERERERARERTDTKQSI